MIGALSDAVQRALLDPIVLAAFITSGFALVATLAGLIVPRLLKHSRALAAVQEQVQNSHTTNLRDDIDSIKSTVQDGFAKVFEQIADLHGDVSRERRERQDLEEKLTGHRPVT